MTIIKILPKMFKESMVFKPTSQSIDMPLVFNENGLQLNQKFIDSLNTGKTKKKFGTSIKMFFETSQDIEALSQIHGEAFTRQLKKFARQSLQQVFKNHYLARNLPAELTDQLLEIELNTKPASFCFINELKCWLIGLYFREDFIFDIFTKLRSIIHKNPLFMKTRDREEQFRFYCLGFSFA